MKTIQSEGKSCFEAPPYKKGLRESESFIIDHPDVNMVIQKYDLWQNSGIKPEAMKSTFKKGSTFYGNDGKHI